MDLISANTEIWQPNISKFTNLETGIIYTVNI